MRFALVCFLASVFLPINAVYSQSKTAAKPIVGLRENRPAKYALTGANVVTQPGTRIENATVLIDQTSIVSVGTQIEIPAGYRTIDCTGKTIYAGLVDAFSEADVPDDKSDQKIDGGHWNAKVTPQQRAADVAVAARGDLKKLRSQGIAVRVVAPKANIIKGNSCVVLLDDGDDAGRLLLKTDAWQHLRPTVPETRQRGYPNSPMGAVALLRQTLHDADWYSQAWRAYRSSTGLPRPETNVALAHLASAIKNDTFVIDAANERMALRADTLASEFSLNAILRGSGREYRDLDAIAATGRAILVPVDFPKKPNVETTDAARNTSLRDLLHWHFAPENPAKLAAARVDFCLTTDGLENVGDFLKQVRVAVDRGLSSEQALAAVTTTPARLLNMASTVGKVQTGMLANLVITDGDLFDDKTKVLETWVAGKQHLHGSAPTATTDDVLEGNWTLAFKVQGKQVSLNLGIQSSNKKLAATLTGDDQPAEEAEEKAEEAASAKDSETKEEENSETPKQPTKVQLKSLVRQHDRLTAMVDLHDAVRLPGAAELTDEQSQSLQGVARITLVIVEQEAADAIAGTVQLPDGQSIPVQLQRVAAEAEDEAADDDTDEAADDDTTDGDADDKEEPSLDRPISQIVRTYPLGAYGRTETELESPTVLFRGATVWTSDDAGTIENGDVLIRDGKIVAVGTALKAPAACHVFDAKGKHITAGLIDCHSHMATDGGVNESGQVVTAEVRIGDFIDNTDINIYRQLAGGLTTSNILHGSANPIGGQNQVIKLRWGQSMEALRMKTAPAGIKFALGENVKRNTSRYPNTRMGVQAIFRDQFLAAREYEASWRDWREGKRDTLPPRRDLQLEAISEIQRGTRWIHCHSYRQDEIVATLDVLEEFGVRIGTLQHILEGYKVADRMKRHGAMASSFSDWWAYKFEVFDAIPYNGALMHQQGVVVSFNSDDRELARHLNTEAAKAVKYGGVRPEEALKFVTLNPAKQLRIDDRVGSIAPGKDADLVVWSGPPLSTLSRCEQTWIDGRRYFDLKTDAELRKRDASLHAILVQRVLADPSKSDSNAKKKVDEEERWARHDEFCSARGEDGCAHTAWERQQQ